MPRLFSIVLVAGATALIHFFRLNRAAGLIGDDAWYVLLARSLATGGGHRLLYKTRQRGLFVAEN